MQWKSLRDPLTKSTHSLVHTRWRWRDCDTLYICMSVIVSIQFFPSTTISMVKMEVNNFVWMCFCGWHLSHIYQRMGSRSSKIFEWQTSTRDTQTKKSEVFARRCCFCCRCCCCYSVLTMSIQNRYKRCRHIMITSTNLFDAPINRILLCWK